MDASETPTVPLQEVTDADAPKVYWFIDYALVGTSQAGRPFFWGARPGGFLVKAVDELGRASSARVKVALVE